MIVVDTNVFIDHLRGFEPATRFFDSISEREDTYFSAISESELLAGSINKNQKSREQLLQFISRWNKIDVNNPIARLAGDFSRDYGLEIPDAIIAASAMTLSAELITKNTKDFQKVKGLHVKSPY